MARTLLLGLLFFVQQTSAVSPADLGPANGTLEIVGSRIFNKFEPFPGFGVVRAMSSCCVAHALV